MGSSRFSLALLNFVTMLMYFVVLVNLGTYASANVAMTCLCSEYVGSAICSPTQGN
jgi:hypothetical protein